MVRSTSWTVSVHHAVADMLRQMMVAREVWRDGAVRHTTEDVMHSLEIQSDSPYVDSEHPCPSITRLSGASEGGTVRVGPTSR